MLKKNSVRAAIFLLVMITAGYFLWFFVCKAGNCSFQFRDGILDPVMSGMFGSLFSIILLMFFPDKIFNKWFKYIVSWYVPIAIFFVNTINIYSGFILGIDRSSAALYWAAGLFILTVIFILIQKYYYKVR